MNNSIKFCCEPLQKTRQTVMIIVMYNFLFISILEYITSLQIFLNMGAKLIDKVLKLRILNSFIWLYFIYAYKTL